MAYLGQDITGGCEATEMMCSILFVGVYFFPTEKAVLSSNCLKDPQLPPPRPCEEGLCLTQSPSPFEA